MHPTSRPRPSYCIPNSVMPTNAHGLRLCPDRLRMVCYLGCSCSRHWRAGARSRLRCAVACIARNLGSLGIERAHSYTRRPRLVAIDAAEQGGIYEPSAYTHPKNQPSCKIPRDTLGTPKSRNSPAASTTLLATRTGRPPQRRLPGRPAATPHLLSEELQLCR